MCKINAKKDEKENAVIKNEPIGDVLSIRGQLHLLGWTSFNAWAQAHGYKRGSVSAAVRTWGLRTDRAPHGGISRAVIRDLRTTLAEKVGPNDMPSEQQVA